MKHRKFFWLFFPLAGIDVLSKYLTVLYIPKMVWYHRMYPYGGIGIFKCFNFSLSLNLIYNTGTAWGFLSNYSSYLFYFRILIFVGILAYLIFSKMSFIKGIPYVLILSGAFGNILDRFFYGAVVDMIHFKIGSYSYPIFNLADTFIVIGIIWIFIDSLRCK